ncbi:MAG: HAD-IB family phosphatase [Anaerorhabdus sp.]
MNVYDFDKTIYNGDCTKDFVLHCFKKEKKLIPLIPYHLYNGLLFLLKIRSKKVFKENLYSFIGILENVDDIIEEYVENNTKNIKKWYYEQQKNDDLIISASPLFLIERFCKKLNITCYMASLVDIKTGKFISENCFGEEKVKRFDEFYQRESIDEFYSDSYSDAPLAKLAKKAFIVKGDNIKPW